MVNAIARVDFIGSSIDAHLVGKIKHITELFANVWSDTPEIFMELALCLTLSLIVTTMKDMIQV